MPRDCDGRDASDFVRESEKKGEPLSNLRTVRATITESARD